MGAAIAKAMALKNSAPRQWRAGAEFLRLEVEERPGRFSRALSQSFSSNR